MKGIFFGAVIFAMLMSPAWASEPGEWELWSRVTGVSVASGLASDFFDRPWQMHEAFSSLSACRIIAAAHLTKTIADLTASPDVSHVKVWASAPGSPEFHIVIPGMAEIIMEYHCREVK